MSYFPIPLCYFCKHVNLETGLDCKAFPEGIPGDILFLKYDHRYPLPSDHGIQFELVENPENIYGYITELSMLEIENQVRKILDELSYNKEVGFALPLPTKDPKQKLKQLLAIQEDQLENEKEYRLDSDYIPFSDWLLETLIENVQRELDLQD